MSARPQPSIRRKLTLTIAITSALALALAAAALVVYDIATYRRALTHDLEGLADLIGNNSTASLMFGDGPAAQQTLESLDVRADVEAAGLYTPDGRRLAAYTRSGTHAPATLTAADGVSAAARDFAVVRQVTLDGQPVGRVFVRSNLRQLEARIWRTVSITSVVVVLSVGLAVLLGRRLQRPISQPIQQLSAAAQRVSTTRDYTLRIDGVRRVAELDVLVETFNDMLTQIQARDQELQRHQEHLEDQVALRTAQLTEAKNRAEEASRAKSDFLANMSHEIRTPMNGVLGMVELALDGSMPAVQREQLETIRSSAESLLGIIDEILDFSKIEAGRLSVEPLPTAIAALARATLASFQLRASQKGLTLRCEIADDVPAAAIVDPGRLRQVLVNLVANGVKFTAEGGVTLAVRVDRPLHDGRTSLIFAVRDTGIGIAADRLDAIFEPFTQADTSMTRRFGGTGLGLTISSRLVSLMGGTLTVQSLEGQGSTFTVSLPAAIADPATVTTTPEPMSRPRAASPEPQPSAEEPAPASVLVASPLEAELRVLVAEDNPVNQKIAQQMLRKRKLAVTLADDGRQAVDAFEAGTFDLVLMDVQMPEMDGFEAVAAIRALEHAQGRRHTPIVAVTAHAMVGDRERCLEAGMDAYLSKPLRSQRLFEVVDELLGVVLDPEVSTH
jgi:signal transduction histidine kinase/ActR/RegA family two-component response regulator